MDISPAAVVSGVKGMFFPWILGDLQQSLRLHGAAAPLPGSRQLLLRIQANSDFSPVLVKHRAQRVGSLVGHCSINSFWKNGKERGNFSCKPKVLSFPAVVVVFLGC